jgi:hypothetical protein
VIYITKIVGESFDLETGEEHTSAIEISNGISTRLIPVSSAAIPTIVGLFIEDKAGTSAVRAQTPPGGATQGEMVAAALETVAQELQELQELEPHEEAVGSPFDPEDTAWEEPQEALDAYEDEDTGVGSI